MKLLVGSAALVNAGVDIGRNPRDYDYIMTWESFQQHINDKTTIKACYPLNEHKWVVKRIGGVIEEIEIAWEGSTGEALLEVISNTPILPIDLAYTLKMSHRYLKDSPHFLKTMQDIKYLRTLGAAIPEALTDWFKWRERETYHYQHPSLNRSKQDFFTTAGVVYTYDHDSIHEAVKLYEKPCYSYFKPDDKDVWCDKEMFFSLPASIQLGAVFEESAVLALERALIPYNSWDKEEAAFTKALQKVCSSITSGWFREYAWENYHPVINMYYHMGDNWLKQKFDSGLAANVIVKLDNQEEKQHAQGKT